MVTYNFNMIVMDMARGEVSDEPYNNMLAIQSQCQQYIDDVLAYLYFGYTDNPNVIYSGVTYTPFNERFQDDVAGMTATLTIQVPQAINNCITPFPPITPPVETLYWYDAINCDGINSLYHSQYSIDRLPLGTVFKNNSGVCYTISEWRDNGNTPDVIVETGFIDCDECNGIVPPVEGLALDVIKTSNQLFRPDLTQAPLAFQNVVLDTQNGWRPPSASNFFTPAVTGTWTWTLTGFVELLTDQGDWPNSADLFYQSPSSQIPPTTTDWPATQPALNTPTPFTMVWTDKYYVANGNFMSWNWLDEPAIEDEFQILAGARLTGVFTPEN
jgi:hypothetical protein